MFFLFVIFNVHKCGVLQKISTLRACHSHRYLLYHYNEINSHHVPVALQRETEELCRSSAAVHPHLAEELKVFKPRRRQIIKNTCYPELTRLVVLHTLLSYFIFRVSCPSSLGVLLVVPQIDVLGHSCTQRCKSEMDHSWTKRSCTQL